MSWQPMTPEQLGQLTPGDEVVIGFDGSDDQTLLVVAVVHREDGITEVTVAQEPPPGIADWVRRTLDFHGWPGQDHPTTTRIHPLADWPTALP